MGVNWGQQVRKQSGHGKIRSYRPREKNRARGWELIVSPENKIRKNKKLLFFFLRAPRPVPHMPQICVAERSQRNTRGCVPARTDVPL